MIVRDSAFKHGVAELDSVEVATWPITAFALDDESPQRVMRLGFDRSGRLLAVVVLIWDDGTEEIIHAMKARPQYVSLLP